MKNKNWLFGLISLIVIIGIIIIWSLTGNKNKAEPVVEQQTGQGEVTGTQAISYFSETAKVMYFYSDSCHWCQKEKEVLERLGKEGYQVKPMDVGRDQNLWSQYEIQGTPTFIAENGEKLIEYKEYDELKKFLDDHK